MANKKKKRKGPKGGNPSDLDCTVLQQEKSTGAILQKTQAVGNTHRL
jgi:hypothetical protein